MRSFLIRGVIAKALVTVASAALLAGCSNSIERFQSAYNNPSDADPVYTASVPKASAKKPVYKAPEPVIADNDVIEETPVERAAIPMAKPKDYASAYKPGYKQPSLTKKPKLVLPQKSQSLMLPMWQMIMWPLLLPRRRQRRLCGTRCGQGAFQESAFGEAKAGRTTGRRCCRR